LPHILELNHLQQAETVDDIATAMMKYLSKLCEMVSGDANHPRSCAIYQEGEMERAHRKYLNGQV